MPSKLALGTVAGHRLGALEWGATSPLPIYHWGGGANLGGGCVGEGGWGGGGVEGCKQSREPVQVVVVVVVGVEWGVGGVREGFRTVMHRRGCGGLWTREGAMKGTLGDEGDALRHAP